MIPSRIFRSRWSALIWAAGIVWTACDVAMAFRPPAPSHAATGAPVLDATGEAVTASDLAILANLAD